MLHQFTKKISVSLQLFFNFSLKANSSTLNTPRTNTPRLSISSTNSLNVRHKEDTLVVNNLEYVVSVHVNGITNRGNYNKTSRSSLYSVKGLNFYARTIGKIKYVYNILAKYKYLVGGLIAVLLALATGGVLIGFLPDWGHEGNF